MTRGVRTLGALMLAAMSAALSTAPALADDTYTVHSCRLPGGDPAGTEGWSFHGDAAQPRNECLSGGDLAAGPPLVPYGQSQIFGWQFDAPADTRIVSWSMYRTVVIPDGDPWSWNWNVFRDEVFKFDALHLVEFCHAPSTPCRGLGDGRLSSASLVSDPGVDIQRVIANVDCYPAGCPANSGATMRIHRSEFTLRDTADPVFNGTPSGDLLDTQKPLAGVRSASFSATDKGGGIYQATVEVDGQPLVTETVDENGGRCVQPFTAAVPCKATASGSVSLDTTALPDGQHSVRLVVSDATGTNAAAFGPVQVTTVNHSPECDPGVRSASSPVVAGFSRTKRRTITRRSTRSLRVVGRIAGVGEGVAVHLLSRDRRTGAAAEVGGTAITNARGSFSLRVPPGPSRRLRAAYRVRPEDAFLVCSRPLNLNVPARATLSASPRRVRPGGRVRLSGRLRGGYVPRRGKLVTLEARDAGRWRDFDTVRTDRRGSFRTSYRFSRRARRGTYPIRVKVRADSSYPFALGYSPAVRVRVR